MQVSVFHNFNEVIEELQLYEVFDRVRGGQYASQIEHLRHLLANGDREAYDKAKKSLPAFTPSATFSNGRKSEFLLKYSGVIHLDFDKIPVTEIDVLFNKVCSFSQTLACFHSPSSTGFKVFVKVNTGPDVHSEAYIQVQKYYEDQLGIKSDSKCKDITRLCFVSHDPQLFCNSSSSTFMVIDSKANCSGVLSQNAQNFLSVFENCVAYTERSIQYIDGNRNNFIYQLASNCNRRGIPADLLLGFISVKYDLDTRETLATIRSAYTNHSFEFGKHSSYPATLDTKTNELPPSDEQSEYEIDYLKSTPFIPQKLYQCLPEILKKAAGAITDLREKDVFLTGALSILSGCIPGVKGVYAQQTVYPNLFSFIVAPAASGKGALKFAKDLANTYHNRILCNSREAIKIYKSVDYAYKARMRTKTDQDSYEEPPQKPAYKIVFIPANTSYAKLLLHLQENEGEGIICETEADTMGNVLKHDWGNYSDMLRKVFHHDRISSSKKTNDEFIEVENPRLSIALSGTPNQVTSLISSSEDGLFSRFLFYAFKAEIFWRDVSPNKNAVNLTEHFNVLSEEVFQMVEFLTGSPAEVMLSESQWDALNAFGSLYLQEITLFNGEETASIIKRLGLILYRLCMVFSALRKFENGDDSAIITCTDQDYKTAESLVETYLQHSLLMFHNLPKQERISNFNAGDRKKAFLAALPQEFKRSEAIEIGTRFSFSVRTIDNLLKNLSGTLLSQKQFGVYSKTDNT